MRVNSRTSLLPRDLLHNIRVLMKGRTVDFDARVLVNMGSIQAIAESRTDMAVVAATEGAFTVSSCTASAAG
jgi:hypothetical protein